MYKTTFQVEGGEDVTIFAAPRENLLELARKANVAIDAPCSGNISCGKCRVRLLSGELDSHKTVHLDDILYQEGWRLACASAVSGDVAVFVPDIASAYRNRMKAADLSSPAELEIFENLKSGMAKAGLALETGVHSLPVLMQEPSLADSMPDNERLLRSVTEMAGQSDIRLPYPLLKQLPELLRKNHFALRCFLESRGKTAEILDLLPATDDGPACGLAVDIGTTTVSGLLVDMQTGSILAKATTGNGQIRYGADVINRIIEQQKPGGIDRLQAAVIKETLLPLVRCLCDQAGVNVNRIYRMTAASNTTMNHLLLGISADPLRMEPYIPAFFHTAPLLAHDLGIELAPNACLRLAPNIGSYVGGDITAGTLASLMWTRPELSLLVDLCTNGEIVLGNSDFLIACACSAGPAFEGSGISCGMRATDGAIESCTINPQTMEPAFSVIGGQRPVGLCGSGIIDVVAELFKAGIIDAKGKYTGGGERIRRDAFGIGSYILAFADQTAVGRDIAVTEVDIDSFIRAKAAIFSATMTLLGSLGFSPADIERVEVAGGIGSGINIKNAIHIGMFPNLAPAKYRYIGNSSLAGAYAMLVSQSADRRLSEISTSMTYLELSTQPGYMDAFLAACFLPHTDAALFSSVER